MFSAAISQLTAPRRDLAEDLAACLDHGFASLAIWRPKLSDVPLALARRLFVEAGVKASSVQWAGGFTGGDGRSFDESVADAWEAIECARVLGAPVVVVHTGCRGGHTRSHARRLLLQAVEALAPAATRARVRLAIKPLHAATAADCDFLGSLVDALEMTAFLRRQSRFTNDIGLAVDLWHFADDPEFAALAPRLAACAAVVQVADRRGPPTPEQERLPVGRGSLPLREAALQLLSHGFGGGFEFDPVGEEVETLGHDDVLATLRGVADDWARLPTATVETSSAAEFAHAPRQRPRAGAGARKSHASSQIVSRG